jgi:hypothetical protein
MTTLQLHVADESDMAARFIAAWKRAEQGDAVNERHLTFLSLRALLATLTPERLALLRHLRRAGADQRTVWPEHCSATRTRWMPTWMRSCPKDCCPGTASG